MIVEKDQSIEALGKLEGEHVQMGVDMSALGQLMDNMAKHLYARPKEAILREYSTNAWDAQVEIGERRPIEVTLPDNTNPVLTIQDYGVGLDFDAIVKVYSQYGASTKRDSNDYNGTFGIGGKAAFAYSNRFTVVSIKDGRRYEIIVTRSEDGTAEMIVVGGKEGTPTDLPRGTTVKIPTKRGDDFKAEAAKLYRWFIPGSVLVNGEEPEFFDADDESVLNIAPGLYVVRNPVVKNAWGGTSTVEMDDLIVMGNVAYPTRLATDLERTKFHLIAFVPIGSVAIPSSREKLIDSSAVTQGKVEELEATFRTALMTTVQKHIDACQSRPEAINVVANWKAIVPKALKPADGYTFDGERIPDEGLQLDRHATNIRFLDLARGTRPHNHHLKLRKIGMEHFNGTLWIENFTAETVSAAQAQKARKHIADHGIDAPKGIVMVDEIPADVRPWVGHVVNYETIKAIKLPRDPNAPHAQQTNSGRIPGSYDLYTTELSVRPNPTGKRSAMTGVPAEKFRHWSVPLFYAVGNQRDVRYLCDGLDAVCPNGYTLVALYESRVDKFKRNFPAAEEAKDAITAGWDRWARTAGRGVALGIALQGSWRTRDLKKLNPGRVDDPDLRRWIGLCSRDLTSAEKASSVFTRILGKAATAGALPDLDTLYPLIDYSEPEHTYLYVNAVYAARQAGATL